MTQIDRRRLLLSAAATMALPTAIAKAWAIDADVRSGTIEDVEHIVILMQENRSFDHYFGTMNGVRGFGDRHPIPLPGGLTVWTQTHTKGEPKQIAPFALNTTQTFEHMRVEGTPHSWDNAQYAWDNGRMTNWPDFKRAHAMGHFEKADIPFQWALADAFTLCEAYHCSFQGGTNTNRLFLWTGTNDGAGGHGGPSISNSHDTLKEAVQAPYTWTTYPERLEAAGVSWKVYEDMADNFGDNPLVGFKTFQDSVAGAPGCNPALAAKGLSTQHLDVLRADVMGARLPSVSWVISPAKDSEHPGPSSPAQGADYVARVLDCLTSNPEVWAKTVFLVMYDENDGYFDHAPPPAPPSLDADGKALGACSISTTGEYHQTTTASEKNAERADLMGRPYGLGPRVPLYVISPWSRGGWVNAEVFDHTSVIRFCEARFGVKEPNISPWRRAVCGDLTSCFDFKTPNDGVVKLPPTATTAARAAALPGRTTPPIPGQPVAPVQRGGARPSRPLRYALAVDDAGGTGALRLAFRNTGETAAVLHAYDRKRLDQPPRRYTLAPGETAEDSWPAGAYDVCVYGPNGFFRSFEGRGGGLRPGVSALHALSETSDPQLRVSTKDLSASELKLSTQGPASGVEFPTDEDGEKAANPQGFRMDVSDGKGWYDLTLTRAGDPGWRVRLAGRVDSGVASTSDPLMGGQAVMRWDS
ncbi:MAG: phospholipase C, phosphocholine-specific [Hyphomonadaceae bacterium]